MDSTSVSDGSAVSLSVVLPVLNEERDIGRLLGELFEQIEPPGGYEVLVVDGGSTDQTNEIVLEHAERHPNLRLLPNPKRLSSAARNVGAWAATGRYVLYLDGHCSIPRKDYLKRVLELFESTGAACLCRPQPLNRIVEGKWAKAIAAARHSPLGHNPGSDIYGGEPGFTDPRSAGAAYLRSAILGLGGYDERFDACEDVEFNHRIAEAGHTAYRHPDLAVAYRPRSTLSGLFRQMSRYGRGRARLMVRHRGLIPWPLVLISCYLASLPIIFLFIHRGYPHFALPLVPVLGGTILVAAEAIRLSEFRVDSLRIIIAFAVIFAGLLGGFWSGLLEMQRYRRHPSTHPISSRHQPR